MALVLNGSGSITGLSAGGLPDGSVTADDIASLPAGSVLQVVTYTNTTQITTTSTSYAGCGLTAEITPSSSSNKILILCHTHASTSNALSSAIFTLFRGTVSGTDLGNAAAEGMGSVYGEGGQTRGMISFAYLDSPSTTSLQLYTLAFKSGNATHTQTAQKNNSKGSIVLMEIAA